MEGAGENSSIHDNAVPRCLDWLCGREVNGNAFVFQLPVSPLPILPPSPLPSPLPRLPQATPGPHLGVLPSLALTNPAGRQHGLCELAAQVLFVIVHYLKTVTQLSSLPLSDQVKSSFRNGFLSPLQLHFS